MSLPLLRRQAGGSHRCSWKNYKVLQRTAKYYASTTPELLCTPQCYANTTLYYPVLQRPSPVLLYTTKYYFSTTLYYKVLRQYDSVVR